MATNRHLGTAASVAQVDKITPTGTWEADDVITFTLSNDAGTTQTLSCAAVGVGSDAAAYDNVCDAMVAAWNASTQTLFAGITAALHGTHPTADYITLSSDSAGTAFYLSVATTENGGGAADDQIITRAAVTENASTTDFNADANYSLATSPADSEDLYFENNAIAVAQGLLAAKRADTDIQLASLNIDMSYTGDMGLAAQALEVSATRANINYYNGSSSPVGSGRINLDFGSTVACTATIYNSKASPTDSNLKPVRIKAGHASTVINVLKGRVGIATNYAGETATIGTIAVDYITSQNTDSEVEVGSGVTLTSYRQSGGDNVISCGATSMLVSGGVCTKIGAGNYTTVQNNGGTLYFGGTGTVTTFEGFGGTSYIETAGTITTLEVQGTVDMRRSSVARTVTTVKLYKGARFYFDPAVVTITNPIQLVGCALSDVTIICGNDKTIAIAN